MEAVAWKYFSEVPTVSRRIWSSVWVWVLTWLSSRDRSLRSCAIFWPTKVLELGAGAGLTVGWVAIGSAGMIGAGGGAMAACDWSERLLPVTEFQARSTDEHP